ncbi:metal-dependent hydrolase, partial [Bacillus thuringiensis]|nr:metal-dependent hydrolase [Bacillus thuringiensis]
LPIGDICRMGPEDAVQAAKWINAKTDVPMHYNTFPVVEQEPYQFVEKLQNCTGKVLEAGESITL